MPVLNDEPTIEDRLGHYALAKVAGQLLVDCNPPFVLGVGGGWGSGKTSFLKKLRVYLGDEFDAPPLPPDAGIQARGEATYWRSQWFETPQADLPSREDYTLIWFNAWHHQFEQTPVVALLHEIREHFDRIERAKELGNQAVDAAKIGGISILDTLKFKILGTEAGIKPEAMQKAWGESRAKRFSDDLTSERFRSLFEKAVETLVGDNGKLVVFIDDLDRCEGETAFKLLEALKLYLNVKRCVYVLGVNREHVERSIADALKREETYARDYLAKMFQALYLLPTPSSAATLLDVLITESDVATLNIDRRPLIKILDENLPHNPRKIKAFVQSWKLYVRSLQAHLEAKEKRESKQEKREALPIEALIGELTVALHYLAYFEEPLFRRIEEHPAFYNEVAHFCLEGRSDHPLFIASLKPDEPNAARLALPYSYETPTQKTSNKEDEHTGGPTEGQRSRLTQGSRLHGRTFYAAKLFTDRDEDVIIRHLVHHERSMPATQGAKPS